MFNLDVLKNIKLAEVEKKPAVRTPGGSLRPEKGDIKIFRNGRIYYSEAFEKKVNEGGLDFIDSRKWPMYLKLGDLPKLIFTCIVSKDAMANPKIAGKVDIKQQSTNSPIAAVRAFVIPMLQEMYNLHPDFHFVELKVEWDYPLTNESGIYNLPKVVSSGDKKGEECYVRREKVVFYPISMIENETTSGDLEPVKDTTDDQSDDQEENILD